MNARTPKEHLTFLQEEMAELRFAINASVATPAQKALYESDEKTLLALTTGWECEHCGCTNERACPGGCSWVDVNLCSACD